MFENRSISDEVKAYEVYAYKKCASFLIWRQCDV